MEKFDWSVEINPQENDIKVISEGVIFYGRASVGVGEPTKVACFVKKDKNIIAGGSGKVEFKRLYIEFLWTAEGERKKGLATKILDKLETFAKGDGCNDILIETLSEITANYYTRLGFELIGKVDNYIPGLCKHTFLKKI